MEDGQADAIVQQWLHRPRFAPIGYEKVPASSTNQPRHHFDRAQTIAISLDRGPAGRTAAHPREPAPVGQERIAIQAQA